MELFNIKYKNIEHNINIEPDKYIGDLVQQSLLKINTFIYSIEDIYLHYKNNEYIKLGRNSDACFMKKIDDIINNDKQCKMIVFLERKRDIHNNVSSSNLHVSYNNYLQYKQDEDMARSLNDRYQDFNNMYTNIISTLSVINNASAEGAAAEGAAAEGAAAEGAEAEGAEAEGAVAPTGNQSRIDILLNNIQNSLNEGVNIQFNTTVPPQFNLNVETITSNTLNEFTSNITNTLSGSLFDSLLNNMNNRNQPADIRVTMQDNETKDLKYMKYIDITEQYCVEHSIVKTTDCTICLESFHKNDNILITECKHLYHKKCADKWLSEYSVKCPICKKKIVKGEAQLNNS